MEVREASVGYSVAADQRVPAGYKQTEVGVIPEDWEPVPLKALGTFSKGQGIRKNEAASGDIPCVRYGEIYTHHNDIVRSFNSRISAEVAKTSRRLKKGDLLFAGSGETKEEIGKCVAFVGDEEAYAGGDIVILSPTKGDSRFFGYLFNAPIVSRQKASKGQGDAVVHISAAALSSIIVPLPPTKAEQEAIAEALSDADALIESLEQLLAKKRHLKQGAMQQLLTGKKRLPGFSGEWEVKRLGDIARFFSGGTPPTAIASYYGGDIPWITSGDLNKSFVREVEGRITKGGLENSSAKMIEADTLLIALYGATSGVTAISKICAAINQAVLAIIPKSDSSFFLFYKLGYLKDWIISTYTQGGQPNLSGDIVKSIQLALPTIEEQTAIATVLSDMDAELAALEAKLAKARALKQGMMQELLTGRIRLV